MIGLAGTEQDGELIRYSAMLAGLAGVREMHFVHVLPHQPVHSSREVGPSYDSAVELIRGSVAEHLGDAPWQTAISYHVLSGDRVDRLLEFAAEHENDLVVVGHRKSQSGRRSLARRLAMKAPCSVWMVPEGSAATLKRVLVPVDFSEPAADAVSVATALANLSGERDCIGLHVYFNEAATTYDEYDEVIRGREKEAFSRFIAPINLHGVYVKPLFEEGANVAQVIGRVAEKHGVDLIVMGTRGRSRSAAILLGSETEHTIMESRIPVLAVKHFGARLNMLQALLDKRLRNRGGVRFSSIL
jgi:nucleotide-binding universal stress UspA family protein